MLNTLRPHGTVEMPLGWKGGWKTIEITGGPFDAAPGGHNAFSVAVRAERIKPGEAHVHLPIRDFSVPDDKMAVALALTDTLRAAVDGKDVYVGCMGGYGRTGLFIALLAKAAGVKDPVTWVRENYHARAVETDLQKQYVANFDVTEIRRYLLGYAWGVRIRSLIRRK